jgi:hypothetical protein
MRAARNPRRLARVSSSVRQDGNGTGGTRAFECALAAAAAFAGAEWAREALQPLWFLLRLMFGF